MEIFKIPRREVRVNVLLDGGQELDGVFHIPASGEHGRPGRLADRLNDDSERCLPLVGHGEGQLIDQAWIAMVRPENDDEVEETGESPVVQRIRVALANGMVLDGQLVYCMPPERCRLLDYFNAAPQFFPLADAERVVLINRRFIVRVYQESGV